MFLGFFYVVSFYFYIGVVGGFFMDGEEVLVFEDVIKWIVDDVCSFVGGLFGCGEYIWVFRE